MYKPKTKVSGHFSSIYTKGQANLQATTITTIFKNRSRKIEQDKKNKLLAEISAITGEPATATARCIDGVSRRWNGVKSQTSD